jgi:hypothetical protein
MNSSRAVSAAGRARKGYEATGVERGDLGVEPFRRDSEKAMQGASPYSAERVGPVTARR